jgi:hypothetical protein
MLLAGWSEGRRAARLAGLAVAMSPQLIAAASSLATETPFTALLLSGVASLVCAVGGTRRSAACAALAGVAFGIASLFRPLALVVAPAIAVVATAGVLIDRHRLDGWRRAAWIAVAVSACVVLPVMVKNGVRFGRFGIANGLGAVMYLGAHPETGGDDPWALGVALSWPPCAGDHHASDCDRVLLRQAVEWIRADPAEFVARIPVKIHRAWIGNQREVFHPARGLRDTTGLNWRGVTWRIASIVCAALLAGAFLWTLARGDWRLDPSSLAVVLTVAVLTLVSALTFAIPRFGEPLLPCFAIAAAIAAARPGRLWPGWVLGAALALCTFLGP